MSEPTYKLGFEVSEGLIRQNLLSATSDALNCFASQQFAAKLQIYLVNYVVSISSYYPIYAG